MMTHKNPRTRVPHMRSSGALAWAGLLAITTPGCGESHTHETHAIHKTVTAHKTTSHAPADPDLKPFEVRATIIDGTVLPGGQNMMLVLHAEPSTPGLHPSPMVLFFQRTTTADTHLGSWTSVLVGKQTREEHITFDSEGIDIASRRAQNQGGVQARGKVIENSPDGFQAEVVRQDDPRIRIRRDLSGLAAGPLLCALNQLSVFNWESDIWSVSTTTMSSLLIGIRTPTDSEKSVDGRWNSISLSGPVVQRTWDLSGGRYVSSTSSDDPGAEDNPIHGSYSLGENGSVALTPDEPGTASRHGTIDPKVRSGIMLMEGPRAYENGAFWWQPVSQEERHSLAGSWRVYGRVAPSSARGDKDAAEFVSGSAEISENGVMNGQVGLQGSEPWIHFRGEINMEGTQEGFLDLEIPVSLQRTTPEVVPTHDLIPHDP